MNNFKKDEKLEHINAKRLSSCSVRTDHDYNALCWFNCEMSVFDNLFYMLYYQIMWFD